MSDGGILVPSRRRERSLLAVLLLEINRTISAQRLVDLLWDGSPPAGVRGTLRSHVSRVRALLAATGAGAAGVTFTSAGGSYGISAESDTVDAHRFRTLVEEAAATTQPVDRIDRLRCALDLWRGPPLDNAASEGLRARLCVELEEWRLVAVEDLASAFLELRREREILPELAGYAAAHPGRERLVGLHMRALYQAGRKIEALESYERARHHLADGYGLDPSPALRELHRAMLLDRPAG